MDDLVIKKNKLLLDLVALEAELSRVLTLNSEPPSIPENEIISQQLFAALELVKTLVAKLHN